MQYEKSNFKGSSLNGKFNYPLENYIPPSVTHLKLGGGSILSKGNIPNSVINLEFNGKFDNKSVNHAEYIPNSVINLEFGIRFNEPINIGCIPDSVIHQLLSPGCIPKSITHLDFSYDFNQPLNPGCIPDSVTHLTFGNDFNQPLNPGCIPNSVTHLTFGNRFNQSIYPGCIPNSVTHINFKGNRIVSIQEGSIPKSVKCLYFNSSCIPKGDIYVPTSVENLIMGYHNIYIPKIDPIIYLRITQPRPYRSY